MTHLPETLSLPLREALTVGEGADARSVTHLQLREPTVGEMKKAEVLKTSTQITIRVLSLVGGIPEAAIKGLRGRDLTRAGDFVSRFVVEAVAPIDLDSLPDQRPFPLDPPLSGPTGSIDSILLKEPLAGQYDEYDGLTGWARVARAIATIGALPEVVVDQLPVRQAAAMEAYIDAFFISVP